MAQFKRVMVATFAGVVTFLAIVFLFSLLTAAAGLTGSGSGAAVVSIIGVLIAFLGAGGVAGPGPSGAACSTASSPGPPRSWPRCCSSSG
jgi:hypothetical protein